MGGPGSGGVRGRRLSINKIKKLTGRIMMYMANDHVALLSPEDEPIARAHQWYLQTNKANARNQYVRTNYLCPKTGKQHTPLLHRLVMQAPAHLFVDHINGNPLDNRRENLRFATRTQNNQNNRKKGVCFDARCQRRPWSVRITVNGKVLFLGRFATESEATVVRHAAEKKYFREFAPKR